MGRRAAAARRVPGTALVLALALPAASAAIEVGYAVELVSSYVWRGITLTEDPAIQPSVTISHDGGASFEVWGNADLGDDNDASGEISETRLRFDYGRRVGAFELGAGLVEYLFPNTPFPGTREVYLRIGFDALVSPRLELHYDFDEIDGLYARLVLAYEHELGPAWSLALEAPAGYADDAFAIGDRAGLHDGGLELRLERATAALDLALRAGWTDSLDEEVLPDQPTRLWAGLSLGRRF